jgi:hypothetical protein
MERAVRHVESEHRSVLDVDYRTTIGVELMSDINGPGLPPTSSAPPVTLPQPSVAPPPTTPSTTTTTTTIDPQVVETGNEPGQRQLPGGGYNPSAPAPSLNRQIQQGEFGSTVKYLGVDRVEVPITPSPEIRQFLDSKPKLTQWDPDAVSFMDSFKRTSGINAAAFVGRTLKSAADLVSGFKSDPGEEPTGLSEEFMNKLVQMLPEELRYNEVLEEMWTLPLIAMVARADPTKGVFLNGVRFDAQDVGQAGKAYEAQSTEIFGQLSQSIQYEMGEEPNAVINQNDVANAATEILSNMLNASSIEIQTEPSNEKSNIETRLLETGAGTAADESIQIRVVDGEVVRSGGPTTGALPYEISTDDDGGISLMNQTPVLNSKQMRDIAQSSEADWDRLTFLDQETFDNGSQTAIIRTELGQYGDEASRQGSRAPVRARLYSPAAASRAIYDLSQTELGNLQDKLVRSGYLSGGQEGFIDRGNASNPATMLAWKTALADAYKENISVDKQIMKRVRNTPLISQVDTYAEDWIRGNLGRNITFGEKQMMRRYVTDPNRQATTDKDLSLGSQVEKFVSAQTKTERETIASNNAGNNARAFALDEQGY